jgi:uncharacterized membrane protein/glutaredoxin
VDNSVAILSHFISELKVPVTFESIKIALAEHPDNSSLLAISDVLTSFKIPNISVKVSAENLINLTCPFIAISNLEEFIVVDDINVDKKKVVISDIKVKRRSVQLEEFLELYGGIALVAEPDEESGEDDYAIKQRQKLINSLRIPAVIAGFVGLLIVGLLFLTSYTSTFSWQIAMLTLFKCIGLATSVLLLVHSIDANNPVIQRLCTSVKSNCSSILRSKAAKITSYFSWSEAGFFYFAGTLIVLLFNSASVSLMQLLSVLNILALPYTFYSIYYQAIKVKQWCVFCSTVQAIFWLEFLSFLPYLSQPFKTPGQTEWSILVICMTIPILFWIFVKPFFLKAAQLEPVSQRLNNLKYNQVVISSLFNAEDSYTLLDAENSIILGNPQAEHTVTFVSNPQCNPCIAAHKVLDPWLATREDIKLQIVFYAHTDKNSVWEIANYFLSLKAEKGETYVERAWADWFKQKRSDFLSWRKAHPVTEALTHSEILTRQKEWCRAAEIKSTPVIFINGRKLPKSYDTKDIKFFI